MNKKILQVFIVYLCYTFFIVLLFYPIVFQSMVPVAPDALVPRASSIALDRLAGATGMYPLWQPWVFSGMPTVEAFSYLSGLYYPNMLFSLFHADGMFLQLQHLVFAGLGVFLLLRDLRVKTLAAVFGGAVFMLNPYMTVMLVHGHGSQLMTAAYMPWLLWATGRVFERRGLADAGLLAVIAGFQLQRAHVQIAYYSWMLALLFALFLLVSRKETPAAKLRSSGLFLLSLVLGVAMSASIYLPASQYAASSVRGAAQQGGAASWEYATQWSMHPFELLTFLVPGGFGFGGVTYWGFMPFTDFPNYAGIIVLLLAVAGLFLSRKEPVSWFLAAALLLSLLLSFGSFFSPVFSLFYHAAPLFSRFRVPSMALVMAYLVLSILSARGLHELLLADREKLLKPLKTATIALAAVALLFLAFGQPLEVFFRSVFPPPPTDSFDAAFLINKVRWETLQGSVWTVVLFAGCSLAALWLLYGKQLNNRIAASLILLFAAGDLLWCDAQIAYPSESSLRSPVLAQSAQVERAFEPDDITSFLASRPGAFRIYPGGPLFGENKFSLFGFESVGGYHPAKLRIYEEFLKRTENISSITALKMLNVGYILSPVPIEHPELEPVKEGKLQLAGGDTDVRVYKLKNSCPRAWFATTVTGVEGRDELFRRVLGGKNVSDSVFVDVHWRESWNFARGMVLSMQRTAERMTLKVSAPAKAFLVVSEVYYPSRWKAQLDGKDVPVLEVNGLIRGVRIPPGEHEVVFAYDRSLFDQGRMISFAAFGIAMLLIVGGVIVSRSGGKKDGEKRVLSSR
ncbi:MAG: YfhO family protein [Chlorobium sp.]|nr:MAG: YfhO family protein [Chlorobium sp.]